MLVYIPGSFVDAGLDKASEENERQHILVERTDGLKLGFTQIAGLVARRIVPFVKPGDTVGVGQRIGLIRFGSRVDVYLAGRYRFEGAAGSEGDRRRDRSGRNWNADADRRRVPVSLLPPQASAEPEERARLGPKAAEDERPVMGRARALTLKAMVPNAITAAALCSGLTGIRFAIGGNWGAAVVAIILAGLLDGIDGRIARALKAQSRFGAELDSLADSLSFGTAPAIIIYLWSLSAECRGSAGSQRWPLRYVALCRLARFNAQIDVKEQPHKSLGFLTGVPAPVGAGLAFAPFYLWMATGLEELRHPLLVGVWLVAVALLMISSMATPGWTSLRPRRGIRLEMIALAGLLFAALLVEPWWTLECDLRRLSLATALCSAPLFPDQAAQRACPRGAAPRPTRIERGMTSQRDSRTVRRAGRSVLQIAAQSAESGPPA